MKIAVTCENGQVFQHFGHTESFMVYDVADGRITAKTLLDTCGSGHGALAGFLKEIGAGAVICGGIGGGAKTAPAEAGIEIYGGVHGSCDDAVNALLAGNLLYDPCIECSHHSHEHEGGHTCGEHGCGEHSCH